MPYPNEFYYKHTESGLSYTDKQTGYIDVNRLVRHLKYWINPVTDELKPKPKRLIFAAWTFDGWSKKKINAVDGILNQLRAEGFLIDFWVKDTLFSWPQEVTNPLKEWVENVWPAYPDDIINKASQNNKHLSADNVFILDDYWVDYLLQSESPPVERRLAVSSLIAQPYDQIQTILNIMKAAKPALKIILNDTFSTAANGLLTEIMKSFPEATVKTFYTEAQFNSSESLQFLKNPVSFLGGLDLTHLEKLTLDCKGLTSPQINQFLLKAINLKHLVLLNCQPQCINIPPKSFPRLTYVKFDGKIAPEDIRTFLLAAPVLEILSSPAAVSHDTITKDNAEKLRSLRFKGGSPLNASDLEAILKNLHQNLNELDLEAVTINDDKEMHFQQPLLLKKIELAYSTFSSLFLNKLLRGAASGPLKKLNINDSVCSDKLSDIVLPANCFKELAEFIAAESEHLTGGGLISIFLAAPNLEQVDIDLFHPNKAIGLEQIHLPKLKKLSLMQSVFSTDDFYALLNAAPNIQELDLSGIFYANPPSTPYPYKNLPFILQSLIRLELDLSATHDDFHHHVFESLLLNAPLLKTLALKGDCEHLIDTNYKEGGFPSIEEILFQDHDLDLLTGDKGVRFQRFAPNATFKSLEDEIRGQINRPITSNLVSTESIHNNDQYLNIKPHSEKDPFKFSGVNKTKSQKMIIEKLSQYLTLKNDSENIHKLQDGICNALVNLFDRSTEKEWGAFIDNLITWDGTQEGLSDELNSQLSNLYKYVKLYQLNASRLSLRQFIGDKLSLLLEKKQALHLGNLWHIISISPIKGNTDWLVYDPNDNLGPRRIKNSKLQATILKLLGNLICIDKPHPEISVEIADPELFIKNGGLLALSENFINRREIFAKLSAHPLTDKKKSLQGLLLRNVHGIPAWIKAFNISSKAPGADDQKSYIHALIKQFIHENPDDYFEQLLKSMEGLTPLERNNFHDNVRNFFNKMHPSSYEDQPDYKLYLPLLFPSVDYGEKFQTWVTNDAHKTGSLDAYCQKILTQKNVNKCLIELESSTDVRALGLALQRDCIAHHRAVFYIRSPEDLMCSSPYVQKDKGGNKCSLHQGPGGPLEAFLRANQANTPPPVLIINYEAFRTEDYICFNSMLDDIGIVDTVLLPKDTLIIGLTNVNQPDCYQGSDFYSRFDLKEKCPIESNTLENSIPPLPLADTPASAATINLFNALDWEARLLGRVVIHGDSLSFEEGLLQQAFSKNAILHIQNGPWHDEKFQSFWQQACLKGFVEFLGQKIHIPQDIKFLCSKGYSWTTLAKPLEISNAFPAKSNIILNPNHLSDFFSRYIFDNDTETIHHTPGIIEAFADRELIINVTRTITEDEWAMLLSACQDHHVRLTAHLAPQVRLPEALGFDQNRTFMDIEPTISPWDATTLSSTQIISSNDSDTTLAVLTTTPNPDRLVIDVSECSASDLLYQINKIRDEQHPFKFHQTTGALIHALKANQQIILIGHFSKELVDELAPLLLERQDNTHSSGQLIIICEDSNVSQFNYFPSVSHKVTPKLKQQQLQLDDTLIEKLLPFKDEPLSQLAARRNFLFANPNATDSHGAWQGIYDLPNTVSNLAKFNPSTSVEESIAFTQNRRDAVNSLLRREPYVFITGISGVGKSTFFENEFCQENDDLYVNETKIQDWATNKTPNRRKILFLDEANLSKSDWSAFEGLFHNPQGILIHGVFYPLTNEHKVVFAGNPLSLGDERSVAPFFKRHGNALVFNPLPPAMIYERLLKPVFNDTALSEMAERISQELFYIYEYLCSQSRTELLITPRELQMMALLILSYHQQYPKEDILTLTREIGWSLSRGLVHDEEARERLDTLFMPKQRIVRNDFLQGRVFNNFLITPSREPLWYQLHDLLVLREKRYEAQGNTAKLYGGLGGIVIEGPPGTGKSDLVLTHLKAQGYVEITDFTHPSLHPKGYYCLPASMSLTGKEIILRKAFHEGAVVLINEINACPMMEKLLNSLLMGKTPENERPTIRPGFMIIGTQNPVSMAGRRAPSNALSRRVMTIELPDFPMDEAKAIMNETIGISEQQQTALINSYIKQAEYAKEHHLSPAPTSRDLFRCAKIMIQEENTHLLEQLDAICARYSLSEQELLDLATPMFVDDPSDIPPPMIDHTNAGGQQALDMFSFFPRTAISITTVVEDNYASKRMRG